MSDIICQTWIIVFGVTSIWFLGRTEDWKRWGYILGLLSEPAWIYTAIKNEQWGILILAIFFIYGWLQGIFNYWILKEKMPRKNSKI